MSQQLLPNGGITSTESITLSHHPYRKSRFFAAFLICGALFVSAFAAMSVLGTGEGMFSWGSLWGTQESEESGTEPPHSDGKTDPEEEVDIQSPDETVQVPEGATLIVERDLTHLEKGKDYFLNETHYIPDMHALLNMDISSSLSDAPMVLVLHTHASEGYLPAGTAYIEGEIGDATYTDDPDANVLSVGRVFAETLNKKGITAIHCTVMHDAEDFGRSYQRALESIQFYLTQYPTIQYVVDLHRDSVLDASGNPIRPVTHGDFGDAAQIMPVVGSDASGQINEHWEGNLALALQLREALNQDAPICRPVTLRNETYNQEAAPFSLLLEIGTAANSSEEAICAAILAATTLAELISGQ